MTPQEFKRRWESSENGGGITFDDVAECAIAWSICAKPRILPMDSLRYKVLKAAGTDDAENFKPANEETP
jgi:hypothetical protein